MLKQTNDLLTCSHSSSMSSKLVVVLNLRMLHVMVSQELVQANLRSINGRSKIPRDTQRFRMVWIIFSSQVRGRRLVTKARAGSG